jgi:hypothetical protein
MNSSHKRIIKKYRTRVSGEPPKKGGILAALRRSPLVGARIYLIRLREDGRKVDIQAAPTSAFSAQMFNNATID